VSAPSLRIRQLPEEQLRRRLDDIRGIAHVGVDVVGGALRTAGQERAGVRGHERISVHIDDAGFRRDPLVVLVGVVGGGQAGADAAP
jgi:hypothetical protein